MTPEADYALPVDNARLVLNGEPVGELRDVQPDMPWFEARFVAAAGFATVEPLFRQERELSEREDFDAHTWQSLWERIWSQGVTLVLPDGKELDRDFAVHIYDDGTARFRY
jgi:hypothetical protein